MTLPIGWYTTARGAGSRGMFLAVKNAIEDGTLDAHFAHVFCNRDQGEDIATDELFSLVRDSGAPIVTLSSVRFRRDHDGARSQPDAPLPEWRTTYDSEVARLVDPHGAQVGVLAGYMLIFTPPFVQEHPILNLHPALPHGPAGTWREVILQLIRDNAPDAILESSALFAAIREAQMAYEAPLLVSALQAFADGRMRALPGRIVDAQSNDAPALDLTAAVEVRRAHL